MTDLVSESAKATQEVAKATGKGLDVLKGLGAYLREVTDDLPKNVIGLLGDYVKEQRVRNLDRLRRRTIEILEARNAKVADAPPGLVVAIAAAAQDIDDGTLSDMWASLLANAADDGRFAWARMEFIETLKQLNPLDAAIFNLLPGTTAEIQPTLIGHFASQLNAPPGLVELAIGRIEQLRCATRPVAHPNRIELTHYGREFLAACKA